MPDVETCLSIRQPWAWAILEGHKRVENRTWRTHYRGPLLVHAGRSKQSVREGLEVCHLHADTPDEGDLVFGAILGRVDVVDCVPIEDLEPDPWACGPWCLVLANPEPFAEPIPWKGTLGLFPVPPPH